MGEIDNKANKEAIKKLQEITGDINTCVFTTALDTLPLSARPIYTKEVDDHGDMWFLLTKDGDHYKELQEDERVQLFYSSTGKSEFLSVYGHADLVDDKERQKELYSDLDKAWFDGPEDPKIAVARVHPKEAYYWDTKHGKVVSLLKIAQSAITNKKADDGQKGKLDI